MQVDLRERLHGSTLACRVPARVGSMPLASSSSVSQADFGSCRRTRRSLPRRTRTRRSEECATAQQLLEPTAALERNDARHLRLRVLFQDSDPAMLASRRACSGSSASRRERQPVSSAPMMRSRISSPVVSFTSGFQM